MTRSRVRTRSRGGGAGSGTVLPVLDRMTSAPIAAYSIARLLTNDYTGFCFKVRRSSDNATQDIGFVDGAMDSAALLSFVGAGSGFVDTLYDQSGNANHAVQTTAGRQFRIVNSGVLDVDANGKPNMVNTDGTRFLVTSNIDPAGATTYTQNAVIPSVKPNTRVMTYDSVAADEWVRYDPDSGGYPKLGRTARTAAVASGMPSSGALIFTHINNGGSHLLYRNAELGVSAALSGSNNTSSRPIYLGAQTATSSNDLTQSEMLLFLTDLSEADRQILETSQSSFYGITLTGSYASQSSMARLTVSGNKIKQGTSDYVLKGVSLLYPDALYTNFNGVQRMLQMAAEFPEMNCVRVPCHIQDVPSYLNYGLTLYLNGYVDPIVDWCAKNNKYCIIDWHQIANYDTQDAALKTFWDAAAVRYKDYTHVIYELYNEPIGPTTFDQAGWDSFKTVMQGWVNYVRALAPNSLFLVSSPVYAQLTQFIPNNPITDSNTAYVHHVYPIHIPGGSRRDINGNPVSPDTLPNKNAWMDTNFGNAADTIPVVMTEWGYALTNIGGSVGNYIIEAPDRASYAEPLMDYMNTKGISWTAWSLDPNGGPNMLATDTTLSDFGSFVSTELGG